jgi:hypothetical protein
VEYFFSCRDNPGVGPILEVFAEAALVVHGWIRRRVTDPATLERLAAARAARRRVGDEVDG